MVQSSFVFYDSFRDSVEDMEDHDRLAFYEAIFDYALKGEPPTSLSKELTRLFKLVRPQIDANIKRKKDGKKGGRPSKKDNSVSDEGIEKNYDESMVCENKNYKKTSGFEEKNHRLENKKPNVNDNVNVNDNANVIEHQNEEMLNSIELLFGRTLSPLEIEKIKSFKNPDLVRYAVEESLLQGNVRNIRYIEKIVFNLEQEGINTYDEAIARKKKYKLKRDQDSKLPILNLEEENYDW